MRCLPTIAGQVLLSMGRDPGTPDRSVVNALHLARRVAEKLGCCRPTSVNPSSTTDILEEMLKHVEQAHRLWAESLESEGHTIGFECRSPDGVLLGLKSVPMPEERPSRPASPSELKAAATVMQGQLDKERPPEGRPVEEKDAKGRVVCWRHADGKVESHTYHPHRSDMYRVEEGRVATEYELVNGEPGRKLRHMAPDGVTEYDGDKDAERKVRFWTRPGPSREPPLVRYFSGEKGAEQLAQSVNLLTSAETDTETEHEMPLSTTVALAPAPAVDTSTAALTTLAAQSGDECTVSVGGLRFDPSAPIRARGEASAGTIECPTCGKEIASNADKCSTCERGTPDRQPRSPRDEQRGEEGASGETYTGMDEDGADPTDSAWRPGSASGARQAPTSTSASAPANGEATAIGDDCAFEIEIEMYEWLCTNSKKNAEALFQALNAVKGKSGPEAEPDPETLVELQIHPPDEEEQEAAQAADVYRGIEIKGTLRHGDTKPTLVLGAVSCDVIASFSEPVSCWVNRTDLVAAAEPYLKLTKAQRAAGYTLTVTHKSLSIALDPSYESEAERKMTDLADADPIECDALEAAIKRARKAKVGAKAIETAQAKLEVAKLEEAKKKEAEEAQRAVNAGAKLTRQSQLEYLQTFPLLADSPFKFGIPDPEGKFKLREDLLTQLCEKLGKDAYLADYPDLWTNTGPPSKPVIEGKFKALPPGNVICKASAELYERSCKIEATKDFHLILKKAADECNQIFFCKNGQRQQGVALPAHASGCRGGADRRKASHTRYALHRACRPAQGECKLARGGHAQDHAAARKRRVARQPGPTPPRRAQSRRRDIDRLPQTQCCIHHLVPLSKDKGG